MLPLQQSLFSIFSCSNEAAIKEKNLPVIMYSRPSELAEGDKKQVHVFDNAITFHIDIIFLMFETFGQKVAALMPTFAMEYSVHLPSHSLRFGDASEWRCQGVFTEL